MTRSGGPSPAEQHLGDRLAALVDGELGHDARERVLAHLATCCKCKAEADAQRRLKSVFAETAPPAPSEGFLARLQGLPAIGGDDDGPGSGSPFADPGVLGLRGARSVREDAPDVRASERRREQTFAYLPAVAPVDPVAAASAHRERGFRIHEVERPGPRRRFAFAAAGAVSLAAFALGAALPLEAAVDPGPRTDGSDTTVTPVDAATVGTGTRERTGGEVGLLATTETRPAGLPSPSATPSHPLLSRPSGAAVNPLIQPALSVRDLLRAPTSTPAAPAPTQLEGPTQPAPSTPYLGFGTPPP
ncbi:zf-HC2 domain-containing protein [Streptomyces sp. NPDC019937]|uniref:anti-sigma factor family protein n=1 Tax=Streptomyces sp. NPDC019937 TaxID=3154787 RepID=UPI0033C92A31